MSNLQVNETLQYTPDVGETANLIRRLSERVNRLEEMLEQRNTNAVVVPNATAATANTIALRDGSGGTAFSGVTATSFGASGNATVGGTLGVTGATTLSSTLGVTSNTTIGGTLAVTGASTLSGDLTVANSSPGFFFSETDQGSTDERLWDFRVDAKIFYIRTLNAALNAANNVLTATRGTAQALTNVTVGQSGVPVTIPAQLTASTGITLARTASAATFGLDMTSAGSAVTLANAAAAFIGAPSASNNFAGWIFIHETAADLSGAIFYVGNGQTYLVSDPVAHYSQTSVASKSCVFLSSNTPVILNNRGGSRTYNIFTLRTGTAH